MILTLTILSSLLVGHEVWARLWPDRQQAGFAERTLYSITTGVLLWLASAWLITLTNTLRGEVVIGRTLLFIAVGVVLMIRRRRRRETLVIGRRQLFILLMVIIPLVAWGSFILWRGMLVPPQNHDALSYHLPKAALYVQEGGYRSFIDVSWLIPPRASNYEVLMADTIVADGTDDLTEWPALLFYVGFVVGGVALAERWWNPGLEAAGATALATAAVPVLLLHAGAHKNDLMFAFFAVAAIVATGRYYAQAEAPALALAIASMAALVGTKTHGAILAAALALLLLWRSVRSFQRRNAVVAVAVVVVAFALLGGADEVGRYFELRSRDASGGPIATSSVGVHAYGVWSNLWKGPWLLIAAPFSPNPYGLSVPWLAEPMFWRRYELFFSHFGAHFSIAAILFPLALFFWRSGERAAGERYAITAAVIVAFVLLLPFRFNPEGLYLIYLPRFVLFVVPIVFAWTIAPAVHKIAAGRAAVAAGAVAAFVAIFVIYAADFAVDDAFVPIDYVMWATERQGTRAVVFDPNRATSIVDRLAGPEDVIAVDPGRAAWLYPAFGASLQRRLHLIPPGSGPPHVPAEADWVVIERSWNAIWGDPDFKDLSSARRYLARGRQQPEDARVLNALRSDDRFQLVYYEPRMMQAVFRRRSEGAVRGAGNG